MEDSYIRSMVRNENLCREYMQKAEDLYIQNGNKHSKEECLLLQKAAMCRSEMAGMSTGEERRFQQRRLQELNQKIESIVRQLNPEAFKNAAGGGKSSSGSAGSSGGSAEAGISSLSKKVSCCTKMPSCVSSGRYMPSLISRKRAVSSFVTPSAARFASGTSSSCSAV